MIPNYEKCQKCIYFECCRMQCNEEEMNQIREDFSAWGWQALENKKRIIKN